jgi:hypothetical protein
MNPSKNKHLRVMQSEFSDRLLAQEKFFHNGFCVEFLGMRRQGVMEAISAWKENVHGSFNLLALEIWGHLFFLGETEGR